MPYTIKKLLCLSFLYFVLFSIILFFILYLFLFPVFLFSLLTTNYSYNAAKMGFWTWEHEKISTVSRNYFCYFCYFYSFPYSKNLNEKTTNTVIEEEKEKEIEKEIEKENSCIDVGDEGSYYDMKNINNNNMFNNKENKEDENNETIKNKINRILINNLNKLPKIINRHRLHSSRDSIEDSEETGLLSDENGDISLNSNINTKSIKFLKLPLPRKKQCEMV